MSVQSEIDRIITAVGNAYSKVSEKGGTVPASQTVANLATAIDSIPSGGTKETWVIKSDASGVFATTQISFTSNGQKYTSIGANYDGAGTVIILYYDNNEIAGIDIMGGGVAYEFYDEADRTITFDTPPTGALLTWLQSNATKQTSDVSVQDTKAVTITSNGTVSVTPDAPYDALSSVDVTVDVASGGGSGFSVTFPATASNWNKFHVGGIIQADGTVIDMRNYSTLAGRTIPNVVEICAVGVGNYNLMVMTVQTGKIMLTNSDNLEIISKITSDGESSFTWMSNGLYSRWIPLKDTVISAIQMYNTD